MGAEGLELELRGPEAAHVCVCTCVHMHMGNDTGPRHLLHNTTTNQIYVGNNLGLLTGPSAPCQAFEEEFRECLPNPTGHTQKHLVF